MFVLAVALGFLIVTPFCLRLIVGGLLDGSLFCLVVVFFAWCCVDCLNFLGLCNSVVLCALRLQFLFNLVCLIVFQCVGVCVCLLWVFELFCAWCVCLLFRLLFVWLELVIGYCLVVWCVALLFIRGLLVCLSDMDCYDLLQIDYCWLLFVWAVQLFGCFVFVIYVCLCCLMVLVTLLFCCLACQNSLCWGTCVCLLLVVCFGLCWFLICYF